MSSLHDMAKMSVSGTPGSGTITLGAAVAGFQSFTASGIADGETVSYAISDQNSAWEVGRGVYTASGTTLTRAPIFSSNTNAAVNLTSAAVVWLTVLAEDFAWPAPNILYNPAMEIDQSGEGLSTVASNPTNGIYVVDGWQAGFHNAANIVAIFVQRVADAPVGFTNSFRFQVSTGGAVAAGDVLQCYQTIEANNMTDWNIGTASAKTLTLSFWVKSSIAPYTMGAALINVAGTRSYPFAPVINNLNTWEKKVFTIPLDTTGTWVTTGNGIGAFITLNPTMGSTFQGTANTWNAGNFQATSAITNTIWTTGATFNITGVKLELSPILTPFVRLPFGQELARCQRYYEKSYDLGVLPGTSSDAGIELCPLWGTTAGGYFFPFRAWKVTKRVQPTMTIYSPVSGTSAKVNLNNTATDVAATTVGVGMNGATLSVPSITPTVGGFIKWQWVANARM